MLHQCCFMAGCPDCRALHTALEFAFEGVEVEVVCNKQLSAARFPSVLKCAVI